VGLRNDEKWLDFKGLKLKVNRTKYYICFCLDLYFKQKLTLM